MNESAQRPEDQCSGERRFPGSAVLNIAWQCIERGTAVKGKLWRGEDPKRGSIQQFLLTEENPIYPFKFAEPGCTPDAEGEIELCVGKKVAKLMGDLRSGRTYEFCDEIARWRVGSEIPCDLEKLQKAGVIIENPKGCSDLFPFVWPAGPTDGRLARRRSILCDLAVSLPLLQELEALEGDADPREGICRVAEAFLASGEQVTSPRSLPGSLGRLAQVQDRVAELEGPVSLPELIRLAEELLGEELHRILRSEDAHRARSRLWQTLLAQTLVDTDPTDQDDFVSRALRCLDFLDRLAEGDTELEEAEARELALRSPIILPSSALAASSPRSRLEEEPAEETGWVELLGVGILKIVRKRLLRYELGEVAFTVNAMPHELRKVSHRERSRAVTSSSRTEATNDEQREAQRTDDSSELQNEVRDLISAEAISRDFSNLTRCYGPNGLSMTLDGSWSGLDNTSSRALRRAGAYAQGLTRRAQSRLTEQVSEERYRFLAQEHEKLWRSELDNRVQTERQVGIYRWLNKVYALSIGDRGRRLIVEFMVPDPAADYLEFLKQSFGVPIAEPTPPGQIDPPIKGFEDITRQNYLFLATLYDAEGVQAPPEELLTVSGTFRRQPPVQFGEITVPAGYRAETGKVSLLLGDDKDPLIAYVGNAIVSLSAGQASSTQGTDEGEGSRALIPVAVSGEPFDHDLSPIPISSTEELPSISPREGEIPVAVVCDAYGYSVGVEIECRQIDHREVYKTWQLSTYNAIVAGFEGQLRAYRETLGRRIQDSSKGRKREIEVENLEKGGTEILLRLAEEPCPEPSVLDEPRYLRFFDRAFEWKEMTYRFYPLGPGERVCRSRRWPGEALVDPDSDALFESFLAARSARVLVPVQPCFNFAVLFFLIYHRLPPQCGESPPLPESYLETVQALAAGEDDDKADSSEWLAEVPTSLVVLQEGSELPTFEAGGRGEDWS